MKTTLLSIKIVLMLLCTLVLSTLTVNGQAPIVYYDFEANNNRNTTVETSPEAIVTGLGSPSISISSLTAAHNTGDAARWGGTSAGYAMGYYGFTSDNTPSVSDPSITFGPYNTSGFSTIRMRLYAKGLGANSPDRFRIYYSTNGTSWTTLLTETTVSNTVFEEIIGTGVPIGTTVYLRIVAYRGGNTQTATNGPLLIDNLTLEATSINTSATLISTATYGSGLSSGGNYKPTYGALTLNGSGITVNNSGSLILTGNLTLTAGTLNINSDTLGFTGTATISRTSGFISMGSSSVLAVGLPATQHTGAFTIPASTFTGSPVQFSSLYQNHTNTITLNQSLQLSGDLNVADGSLNDNGQTLTVQGNVLGIGTFSGSGKIYMTGSTKTIAATTFTNLQLDNAGGYALNSSITITGTLTLTNGNLAVGSNTLTFTTANTPITAGSGKLVTTSASGLAFGAAGSTGGSAFTIPNDVFSVSPMQVSELTINRANALTWNNQDLTINGTLTLTAGVLNVSGRTITFQNDNTPIVRSAGSITTSTATSLVFGTTGNTGGSAFTIPNGTFTSAPSINNLTVNRTNTLTWNTQNLTINGTLTLTAGSMSVGTITLTFQNGNTPIARAGGNLTLATTTNISFGSTGNTGGNAFTIPDNTFSADAEITDFTLTRTNSLTLGNQNLTIRGTLTLTSGRLNIADNDLTFIIDNTPIARNGTTQTGTIQLGSNSGIAFGTTGSTGGAAFTIPNGVFETSSFNNITINRANTLTWNNQDPVINGTLTLTAGVLDMSGRTITFQNGNTPIARTSGTLTTSTASSIIFGTSGNNGGNAFTIPNSTFTSNPTLVNLTINRTNQLTWNTQNLTLTGSLTLTAGNLSVASATFTFQTGNTPIVRTSGQLVTTSTSSLVFGTTGNTGGSAFTLPNNLFSTSPFQVGDLTINRTNALTWNNQDPTINGTLTLTAGVINLSGRTITFQNDNTPISRAAGTITTSTSTSLVFGTTGNTGGTAFTIPNSTFTSTPSLNNITVNRTNTLTWNTQNLTINGTLTLTAGSLSIGAITLTFQNGNTPIARTSGSLTLGTTSNIIFGTAGNTGGNAFTIPDNAFSTDPDITNFTINRTNDLTLGNQNLTIRGALTLTSGKLDIAGNDLTFITGATPIVRDGTTQTGTLASGNTSNLAFGITGTTGGAAFTIPNNVFHTAAFNNITINRTNAITWNNQDPTINGTLTLTAGVLNMGERTLTFQNGNTPIARTSGTLTLSTAAALVFGTTGNTGGTAFTIPNSIFTTTPTLTNVTINRTNQLTWNTQNLTITGTLTLTAGNFNIGATTLTFQTGNTPIIRTNGGIVTTTTSNLVFGTTGNTGGTAFTIPDNAFATAPDITNLTVNRTNSLTWNNQSLTIRGALTLTAGRLDMQESTLTFITGNTPIVRTSGTLALSNSGGTLAFGTPGNTTGNAFTIPDNTFVNAEFYNIAINRTNAITWNNQDPVVNGTVTLTAGVLNISGRTFTFQNGNTPLARTSGTLTTNTATSLVFGTTGNTGGDAFTLPNGLFTSATFANLTVNRNNSLSWNNQAPTIGNDLNLIAGNLIAASGVNLGLSGNITGTGTFSGAGIIVMSGASRTISGATISNLQLNNAAGFSLAGSPTITDVLTLTVGTLSIGSNTLTFRTGNSPIVRTSGTITTTASSNLVFGTTGNTGGNAFTLPNSLFATASFGSLTINRTNTLTWNSQSPTLAGDLNLIAGTLSTTVNFNLGGNITGTGTQSGAGIISMTGASKTISGATLANLQLNNAAGFSLTGSPIITDALTLAAGALAVGNNTLTFHTGNTPIVRNGVSQTGTITVSSGSNLVFGITGNTNGNAFTLPDNCFTSNPELASLTINRTNSLTLNNQPMGLRHLLQLTQGTLILPAGYVFNLRSLSIANTAMVGRIGTNAGIQYGTGAIFRVERHIPQTGAGIRAYRDIAPSVNTGTGTIYQNWQESGTNGLENGVYYGTHITGKAGGTPGGVDAASGLDKTQTAAIGVSYMRTNPTTGKSEWISKTSSKLAADTLTALQGYRVLIRGNRLVDLYQNPTPIFMNAGATVRASGRLITGDVVYTTTGTTANGYTNTAVRLNSGELNGFTMLGNPYASPIVWDSLVNNSSNIQPTYWLFDPNIGSAGGYITYNALTGSSMPIGSAATKFIQPGQAFFIRNNNSTNPSLTIRERHKAPDAGNLTLVFRSANSTAPSAIQFVLNKNITGRGLVPLDGSVMVYDSAFSNNLGTEDGTKITNSAENMSILSNDANLSTEGRKAATINDTIQLRIWNTAAGNFSLTIDPSNFISNGLQAYLLDRFTNTQTTLNMDTANTYNFTVTADTLSFNRRFRLVFKTGSTLPATFLTVRAARQNTGIQVSWEVAESNISHYEIQRAATGYDFTAIGQVQATGNGHKKYQFTDAAPLSGNNYYRIKAIETSGNITYSSVVLVSSNGKPHIGIYPNPVTGKTMQLQFSNMPTGQASLALHNSSGQQVYSSKISVNNGSQTQAINLPQALNAGLYILTVSFENNQYTLEVVLE